MIIILIMLIITKCAMLVVQSCPILWNPMGCSPPGSSVHGILQARILEWVAIPFSRVYSQPTDLSCMQADSLPSEPLGKPRENHNSVKPRERELRGQISEKPIRDTNSE